MSTVPDAISVVIPTYNRAHLIKESLQSVLNQTLQPLEIIVVDDFSTDNTEEVVASLNSPLIKYVKNQRKKGANGARNTGIVMAQGEFIAFHDSDDVWLPEKLELQQRTIKQDPTIDLCFCSLRSCDPDQFQPRTIPAEKITYSKLLGLENNRNVISTQTIFTKTDLAKSVLFDETLKRLQDWDFILNAIKAKLYIYHLDEVLVKQFVNSSSISNTVNEEESYLTLEQKHPILKEKGILRKKIKLKKMAKEKCSVSMYLHYLYLTFKYRLNGWHKY